VIVADTNIVSTFARVEALHLLLKLLEVGRMHITSATFQELNKAIEAGCTFLTPVLDAISLQLELDLVELTEQENLAVRALPGSLGAGEAGSIAVCLNRAGSRLLTNDKRARNYCREKGIPCLDLPALLRAFWVKKVLTKKKVKQLIRRIETEQGMVIKNKEEILK
jgi:predicted nucleic acid-binding protein